MTIKIIFLLYKTNYILGLKSNILKSYKCPDIWPIQNTNLTTSSRRKQNLLTNVSSWLAVNVKIFGMVTDTYITNYIYREQRIQRRIFPPGTYKDWWGWYEKDTRTFIWQYHSSAPLIELIQSSWNKHCSGWGAVYFSTYSSSTTSS